MEPASARKFEWRHHDRSARRHDRILRSFQFPRIEHYQRRRRPGCGASVSLAESAVQSRAGLVKADVVRTPILKAPAKYLPVKLLGLCDVGGEELDVRDRVMLRGFTH